MEKDHRAASTFGTFFWTIFLFCLFGILALGWFRWGGRPESFDHRRASLRAEKLKALLDENHQKLDRYAWIDKTKGSVQLSIRRAVEVTVADLKNKPVQASAVKVEVPYPTGLSQPVASPVPAGSSAPGVPTAGSAAGVAAAPSASPAPSNKP
jgi:hypothetical protein